MRLNRYLIEDNEIEVLKKNKVPLSDEERDKVMKAGAVWHNHFGKDGKRMETPAIWKSSNSSGDIRFVCNTHRAYQAKDNLDAAIKSFEFIKTTA